MKLLLALTSVGALSLPAAPLKILVIGDSQSEEYRFEIPFSAPASVPFDANMMNWIEILSAHREDEVTFGKYRPNLASYPDVRNGGYEFNWSIPGALTETWVDVLNSSIFENPGFVTSKITLLDQLDEVDAVVIFLGGNDMNNVYNDLTKNNPPPGWPESVIAQINEIVAKIRNQDSNLAIVIGNFPDVGGTQKRQLDFPDRNKRDLASSYIADANEELRVYAERENIPLFDVAAFTLDLIDEAPYRIAGVEFFPFGDPENKSRKLLCRDGFHPATSSQAMIANGIIGALNTATGSDLIPLGEEEIVTDILGLLLTTDEAYLAWIAGFQVANDSLLADPDGDGIANLGEYALDHNPTVPDAPRIDGQGNFDFTVETDRADYVRTAPAVSSDLNFWIRYEVAPPFPLPERFLRLEFTLEEGR